MMDQTSGPYLEVEEQSKGREDRTIASPDKNPDKDLVDIVGRQQYKQLSSHAAASKASAVVTRAATKTTEAMVTSSSKVKTTAEADNVRLTVATTFPSSSISFSGPLMVAKSKPVSTNSIAAIAASNENNLSTDGNGEYDVSPEKVVQKGRLMPGKMLLVDTEEKRIIQVWLIY